MIFLVSVSQNAKKAIYLTYTVNDKKSFDGSIRKVRTGLPIHHCKESRGAQDMLFKMAAATNQPRPGGLFL